MVSQLLFLYPDHSHQWCIDPSTVGHKGQQPGAHSAASKWQGWTQKIGKGGLFTTLQNVMHIYTCSLHPHNDIKNEWQTPLNPINLPQSSKGLL